MNPSNPKNSIMAARFLETIGLNFKKDLDDLDRTLASVESEQLRKNDFQDLKSNISQPMKGNEEMIKKFQEQKENMNQMNQQREFNKFREQSIPPTVVGANAAPTSPTSTAGSPVVGSSITGSNELNPGAAASLYAGNTDMALANQYGGGAFGVPQGGAQQMPRMAAKGGIISLVS